jgi:ABC-type transporter Mla subunit MlaD
MSRSLRLYLTVLLVSCSRRPETIIHVMAQSAPGVKAGSRVQYRGVDVGAVREVYFTPNGVRIDLAILRQDAPIRTQDSVRVISVGAFGEQVVEIRPGVSNAPLVARSASLPVATADSGASLREEIVRAVANAFNSAAGRDSAGSDRRSSERARPENGPKGAAPPTGQRRP